MVNRIDEVFVAVRTCEWSLNPVYQRLHLPFIVSKEGLLIMELGDPGMNLDSCSMSCCNDSLQSIEILVALRDRSDITLIKYTSRRNLIIFILLHVHADDIDTVACGQLDEILDIHRVLKLVYGPYNNFRFERGIRLLHGHNRNGTTRYRRNQHKA
ncbi:hypothetical protein D3C78_866530 [compost metagenome]